MAEVFQGVTLPQGFLASGASAGIKKGNGKDMALIFSQVPCRVAGTFTTNAVKAAPVLWDKKIVSEYGISQAIVCNSGIANACTGAEGMEACEKTAQAAAEALDIPKESVLIASTGVIGAQIPVEKIVNGISVLKPLLSGEETASHLAAKAIMTTDTRPKEVGITFEIGGKKVSIGGMCKGSGMIHPNMCTMLSFLTTDVAIDQKLLQEALSEVVEDTYNMVSVDGDTSTNDTVLLLANGMAGNPEITEKNEDYEIFKNALLRINVTQAKNIAADGEGATALFEVTVKGMDTKEHARTLAKSVITSSLTKAAIFGHDANWGRILCALGYAGVEMNPDAVDLYFESKAGRIHIAHEGHSTGYSEEEATKILSEDYVSAVADMHMGDASATAWGCDLTYDYVKINADYRS